MENWNRAEFYFRDLVIPMGHLCFLNLLENTFGNVIFIGGLKILVNDLEILVVTSVVAIARVLSAVWYFLFFSLRSILRLD